MQKRHTIPTLFGSLLLCLLCSCASVESTKAPMNVREYGATGDGRTLDSAAIQRAIDQAHATGGGIVHVPAGTYLSGTIELRSGVTLDLAKDAVILGSPSLADYRRGNWPALILARNQTGIAITGQGAIDGNSQALVPSFDRSRAAGDGLAFVPNLAPGEVLEFIGPTGVVSQLDAHALQAEGKLVEHLYGPHTRPYEYIRPQIIEFWGCRDITLRDITLRNAANWVQTYRDCEDMLIERIKVRSTEYWNNDGIDLVDCRRVLMVDCDIDSADDALCLKSDPLGEGCADITVLRCKLASRASGIKFGTASHHGFKRIHIADCEVRNTYRSVVAIQSVDGGVIENVTIERIKATNVGNPFFVRIGHRTRNKAPGSIRNVILRDMDITVRPERPGEHMDVPTPHNQIPSSIVGLPGQLIENVLLENITVREPGGGKREKVEIPLTALDSVPDYPHHYPEFSMWGELPAWGAYIRHARGVTFRNVSFLVENADFRPAIVADNAPALLLDRVAVSGPGGEPIVALRNAPGATITAPLFPASTSEAVRRID